MMLPFYLIDATKVEGSVISLYINAMLRLVRYCVSLGFCQKILL